MKKISIMLVLSLLMCLIMVFPASAVVNQPTWNAKVMKLYDALQADIAPYIAEYPYQIYIYTPHPYFMNTGSSYREILNVFLCKKPEITVGDSIIQTGLALDASGNIYGKINIMLSSRTISNIKFQYYSSTTPNYSLSFSGVMGYGYYISDISTATFYSDNILPSVTGYYDYTVTVIPTVDPSALEALISQAKSMQDIGYTPSSWQNLQTQITAAESLLSTSGYTQTQVDNEVFALQTALNGLVVLPDITVLQSLLVDADAITDIGYTEPTWQRFQSALFAARSLVASGSYTESDVSAISTELSSSVAGLTLKAIVPPPVSPFDPNGYNLLTGEVMGFLAPVDDIFFSYVMSVEPIWILLLSIVLGILIIPKLFALIIFLIKR